MSLKPDTLSKACWSYSGGEDRSVSNCGHFSCVGSLTWSCAALIGERVCADVLDS